MKNIVMLSSDSHDGRVLGTLGYPGAYTPNMDRLSARGACFENMYCNSPQCVPSRASMWSGRYVHEVQAWNNYKGIEPETPTFQTELTRQGYRCATFGKTDYLSGFHTLQNRITAWFRSLALPIPEKKGPRITVDEDHDPRSSSMLRHWEKIDAGCDWLKANQDEPFFCYFGPNPPHPGAGYNTNRYWWDKIDESKVSVPPEDPNSHPVMDYMKLTKGCHTKFTESEIRNMRRGYLARIAEVDAMLGQVLDTLEACSLLEDTLVIYMSDHGDMQLEHGQYLKNSMYESSVRVPFIAAGEGVSPGVIHEDLYSLIDVFPTLLDWAGCPKFKSNSGQSLLPVMRGEAEQDHPEHVFCEYHSNFQNTGSFMLREGDWKLIEYIGFPPMLFNLKHDPDELHNLAPTALDQLTVLRERMATYCDIEEVDRKAKQYDKEAMATWRDSLGDDAWEAAISQEFDPWTSDDLQAVKDWLSTR